MSARTYQSVYVYLLKWVPRTYSRECAYLPKCLRVLTEVNTSYLFSRIRVLVVVVLSTKSPNGAILFHSPGRKPWVRHWYPFIELRRSGTPPIATQTTASPQRYKPNVRAESAAPEGAHITFRFVCTQGFISGLPSFHPGLCRSVALTGLISASAKRVFYFEGLIYVSPPIHLLCCFEAVCVGRASKGQVLLVLLLGFAECGNSKALRLKAQGVYSCKWPSLNVENNAASAVLCNGLSKGNRIKCIFAHI